MATKEKIFEELAEAMVFADVTNMQTLGHLLSCLEELSRWAEEASQPKVVQATEAASKLIGKIVLYEVSDQDATLEIVSRTVSALQEIIRDGRSVEEVTFPEELGPGEGCKSLKNRNKKDDQPSPVNINQNFLPDKINEKIFAEFLERQPGVLEEIEALILTLEKSDDANTLGDLRRHIHTIKGEAGLLGLTDVERLCHSTEDLLDNGQPDKAVDVLLRVKDWLAQAFDFYSGKSSMFEPIVLILSLLKELQLLIKEDKTQEKPEPEQDEGEKPIPFEADLDLLGGFASEAIEHLDNADVYLLTLEAEPQDEEALNAVFRAFHTIKGSAGFLELDEIGTLSHEAENLLDLARKGKLILTGSIMDVIFDAVDALKKFVDNLCDALSTGETLPADDSLPQLLTRIKEAAEGKVNEEQSPQVPVTAPGMKLGEILVESGKATEEDVEKALGKMEMPAPKKKIGEILAESNVASSIKVDEALKRQQESPDETKLGEVLVEMGAATGEDVEAALEKQQNPPAGPRLGEQLVRDGEVAAKDVAQALRTQKNTATQQTVKVKETVKVDADRLDRLVETIGELVIAESIVSQFVSRGNGGRAQTNQQMGHLDKITRELQELGTSLRMVSVRPTFQKMARLVRDLARKAGKQIEFSMSGEDTELDKTVVDNIGDPLVHMVRNAVDHGIEANPEDRRNTGKSKTGHIELRAFHKGGNINIEIQDDGRGLDREVILAKARERGLVSDGDSMSDREVFNMIFQPGFSTAAKITDISGRGVGMDVVRRNIDALRGQVEISSELGKGSVFTIRMPLTLAIIDGMVLRAGQERYIIPTLSIVRSVRPQKKDLTTVLKRGEMLSLHGELIPLLKLDRLFNIDGAEQDPSRAIVVVVEDDGRQTGLIADELLGQQQIVIKSLGDVFRNTAGISGGAIMPDGRVGMILDIGGLVKLANNDEVKILT